MIVEYPTRAEVATATKGELEHWYRECAVETSAEQRVIMDAIRFKLTDFGNGILEEKNK